MLTKLQQGWQHPNWSNYLAYPVSLIYQLLFYVRSLLYRAGLIKSKKLSVPVIVVGNISVGGTGKTPLVIALVKYFQSLGYKPGVISRGYKAESPYWPRLVKESDSADEVGDEPLFIHQECHAPVVVGPNRVLNGQRIIENGQCDIVISDDGFQHWALKRDVDIVVVDGPRGFGNGWCLPAGPLREPISSIHRADMVVMNGEGRDVGHINNYSMSMKIDRVVQIKGEKVALISQFSGQKVHAIAGIGNPDRFFDQLGQLGLDVINHPFDDHHHFIESDLEFVDDLPVLMTQKDAVKCESLIQSSRFWSVPAEVDIDSCFFDFFKQKLL